MEQQALNLILDIQNVLPFCNEVKTNILRITIHSTNFKFKIDENFDSTSHVYFTILQRN